MDGSTPFRLVRHRKLRGVIRQTIAVTRATNGFRRLYEARVPRLVRIHHDLWVPVVTSGAMARFALDPGKSIGSRSMAIKAALTALLAGD